MAEKVIFLENGSYPWNLTCTSISPKGALLMIKLPSALASVKTSSEESLAANTTMDASFKDCLFKESIKTPLTVATD